MPSQISTSAAATAAEEKLKIQALLTTLLGSACWATAQRVVGQQFQERIAGIVFDALGEGEQALFELRDTALRPAARRCAG